MLRRDSPTPREHMSERLWMRNRMTLLYSVCHHHEFVKTSHRGSHETCSPQVLTEPNAMIIADRQGGGVDVVDPGPGPQAADEKDHQRHEDAFLQGDEVLVAGHAGKVAAQQRLGEAVIEALEMFET